MSFRIRYLGREPTCRGANPSDGRNGGSESQWGTFPCPQGRQETHGQKETLYGGESKEAKWVQSTNTSEGLQIEAPSITNYYVGPTKRSNWTLHTPTHTVHAKLVYNETNTEPLRTALRLYLAFFMVSSSGSCTARCRKHTHTHVSQGDTQLRSKRMSQKTRLCFSCDQCGNDRSKFFLSTWSAVFDRTRVA